MRPVRRSGWKKNVLEQQQNRSKTTFYLLDVHAHVEGHLEILELLAPLVENILKSKRPFSF